MNIPVFSWALGRLAAAAVALFVIAGCSKQPAAATSQTTTPVTHPVTATLEYIPTPIGASVAEFGHPWVTNVAVVDLDQDGLVDVLY